MIYRVPEVGDLIAGPYFHVAVVIERKEDRDPAQGQSVGYYRMLNSNGKFEWYSEDYVRTFCDFLWAGAGRK